MKHVIIAALLLATATGAIAERMLLVAIRTETWQDASPTKRDKIKTFFRRFVTEGHGVTPQARYIHTASGKEIMVACYEVSGMNDRENISQAKIDDVKTRLADNKIRIEYTDDPHATLKDWGLESPQSEVE